VARCYLCGAGTVPIQRGARHQRDAEIHRCPDCGLVALEPRPTQEQLDAYYAGAYRREYANPSVEETMPDARARIERLRPFLHEDARVLDVGAGAGAFVQAVAPLVAHAEGVEPSEGTDLGAAGSGYDLVTLFHVLEHVADPVDFLAAVAARLAPGARLVVEVPNVQDALVSVYDIPAYRAFYFQKAHLWYFDASTLTEVLRRAGLGSEVSGVQRYGLANHVGWMLAGERGGDTRYPFLAPVDIAYAGALATAGHADTLWAVAERS
jgi:2-polyprenyl-3-methyl-5-hydroxy-6-metoxy-1,4-benzoquinol methylase